MKLLEIIKFWVGSCEYKIFKGNIHSAKDLREKVSDGVWNTCIKNVVLWCKQKRILLNLHYLLELSKFYSFNLLSVANQAYLHNLCILTWLFYIWENVMQVQKLIIIHESNCTFWNISNTLMLT